MNPTLKQIRYFIAVANVGSISKAALDMYVSQSAITSSIKSLETMLDVKLLIRKTHGVELTTEGKKFLQHSTLIMREVEEAMSVTKRANSKISGKITLAFTYTISGYFIPPYITRFKRRYPNIDLNLIESTRPEIEEGIIAGQFDIAIILTSNLFNQEATHYKQLLSSKRRVWMSSHNGLVDKESINFYDISQQPYLMLTVDEASNSTQRYWNKTPYQPNVIFRTASVEAVRSMVGANNGVTILSNMVYHPWSLEGHRIEVRTMSEHVPAMDIGLVWSRSSTLSPAAQAFYDFMVENVQNSSKT